MTVGSIDDDDRVPTHTYALIQPQGWYVNESYPLSGAHYNKTWIGGDFPTTKPVYQKYRFLYGGKWHTVKERVDKPVRSSVKEDHPYSCSILMERGNSFAWDRYEYGSLSEQDVRVVVPSLMFRAMVNPGWSNNDDIALIGKLREKVAGSDFNMGVFLGEGREALSMIAGNATKLFKAYSLVKQGNIIGAAAALATTKSKGLVKSPFLKFDPSLKKSPAKLWLELQYGWLPLIKDVQGGAEFLGKLLNFPMVQTYKVRTKKKWAKCDNPDNYTNFYFDGKTTGQLIAKLTEVNPYQLSGLLDPASVAWELTPFSFVADWFIPIGNYLAARSLASALTGTFVTTKTVRIFGEADGLKNTDNGIVKTIYTAQPRGFYRTITVDRTVSTSLQVPLPNFKTLDKIASWKHCANAVALLIATHGSGKSSYKPPTSSGKIFKGWDGVIHS